MVDMKVNSNKTLAITKDYEGNTVKLLEVQMRGISPFTNEYDYQIIYMVIVEYTFPTVSIFTYSDKQTGYRMFKTFLTKPM